MANYVPILFLFSTSFFFFLDHLVSPLSDMCSDTYCKLGEPGVRFPFRLKQFQPDERCVYPGFDLSCNARKQTTLNLPNSGEFIVDFIDYIHQVIWLRDPDDCLPKRLQNFAPSGSNFIIQRYTNYSLFDCPMLLGSLSTLTRMPCLDDRNYSLVAVAPEAFQDSTRDSLSENGCTYKWLLNFPTVDSSYSYSPDNFGLTWVGPSCGKCEARSGRCQFKRKEGLKTKCIISDSEDGATAHWWIFLGISMACFMFVASLFNYISSKLRARAPAQHDQTDPLSLTGRAQALVMSGMETREIELYPKTRIGDGGGSMPRDNTCSICLSKYKLKEVLRTIPECKHSFHAHCIDPWLKRNASCPLCRSHQGGSAESTVSN